MVAVQKTWKATLKHYDALKKIGFTEEQVIQLASHNGGSKNLEAIVKHYHVLKAKGFTQAQLIKLASHRGGSLNIKMLCSDTDTLNASILAIKPDDHHRKHALLSFMATYDRQLKKDSNIEQLIQDLFGQDVIIYESVGENETELPLSNSLLDEEFDIVTRFLMLTEPTESLLNKLDEVYNENNESLSPITKKTSTKQLPKKRAGKENKLHVGKKQKLEQDEAFFSELAQTLLSRENNSQKITILLQRALTAKEKKTLASKP